MDRIDNDWHAQLPHSFGGKYRAYEYYKDVLSKKFINEEYKKLDTYSKFKEYRRPKYFNPVYVHGKREQFEADVVKFNDRLMVDATGHSNLLVLIDVFTKYVYLFPLKQITAKQTSKCLETLFSEEVNRPKNLRTDSGGEFVNRMVKKVLNKYNIKHYIARNKNKCSVVERFNRTIQRLIYQMCRYFNTNDWISILDNAKSIYLNRSHRTIKMTPLEAEKEENQAKLREIYAEKYKEAEIKRKKPKFKVGDTVRISILRTGFARGYHQNFTTEIWTVCDVFTNLPQPRYRVKDDNGEILLCVLNENELVAFKKKDNVYRIDKILKERRRKGRKEFFVHWLGYPNSKNSWISENDIRNTPK